MKGAFVNRDKESGRSSDLPPGRSGLKLRMLHDRKMMRWGMCHQCGRKVIFVEGVQRISAEPQSAHLTVQNFLIIFVRFSEKELDGVVYNIPPSRKVLPRFEVLR